MAAYYNEIDKNAAEWLRELIKAGAITDGEVDERSIEDVLPADLAGFDRCHFFAGIGAWDYALDLAGWEGQVWTGSCPCQPFSTAGKRGGFDDERHLWPAWFHLIEQCRPHTVFGEQVASKDGLTWLDLVSADVEGIGYSIGAIDLPAAGVGAPHRRQRFFFGVCLADAKRIGRRGRSDGNAARGNGQIQTEGLRPLGVAQGNAKHDGPSAVNESGRTQEERRMLESQGPSAAGKLDNTELRRSEQRDPQERSIQELDEGRSFGVALGDTSGEGSQGNQSELLQGRDWIVPPERSSGTGPTNGFWSDAEWIYCRDEKYRATKPGIFPLVDGVPGRVGLLRGAGNAISPWAAKVFIESWQEIRENLDGSGACGSAEIAVEG